MHWYQAAGISLRMYDRYSSVEEATGEASSSRTLINEGMFGRFFEVTPAGEVVWEYVNPYFVPAERPAQSQTNSVFRVYRYTAQEVPLARANR